MQRSRNKARMHKVLPGCVSNRRGKCTITFEKKNLNPADTFAVWTATSSQNEKKLVDNVHKCPIRGGL